MKSLPHFSRLVLPCLLTLLVSCASSPPPGYLERDPEALGRRTGRADALAGLSQRFERHLGELHPSADEDDFEDAYDDAYEAAQDAIEDHNDDRQSAYEAATDRAREAGYEAGDHDHDRGLSRNPYRHGESREGSSSVSEAWIAGYEDGWNGR